MIQVEVGGEGLFQQRILGHIYRPVIRCTKIYHVVYADDTLIF